MKLIGTTSSVQSWNLNIDHQDLFRTEKHFSEGCRWIYRHRSQMGSVIQFEDTRLRKVLVLDAKYRKSGLYMGESAINPSLSSLFENVVYRNHCIKMGKYPYEYRMVQESDIMQYRWCDRNSSADNTLTWLQRGSEVAQYTKSILINGAGCDIPNFQTLQRIFCEGYILDSLDPTVNDYPQHALSNWFNNGVAWSSSEFGIFDKGNVMWGIHSLGVKLPTITDNLTNFVIPVQEIK